MSMRLIVDRNTRRMDAVEDELHELLVERDGSSESPRWEGETETLYHEIGENKRIISEQSKTIETLTRKFTGLKDYLSNMNKKIDDLSKSNKTMNNVIENMTNFYKAAATK